LGPYVVQIWSRAPRISAESKPSNFFFSFITLEPRVE
jgi:hypothetical protein